MGKCGILPPVNHNCCTKCGPFGKGFCSPQSGRCYDFQAKPHYQRCGVSPPVRPPVTHPVHSSPVLSLLDGQCLALNLRRGEIVIEQCNGARTQQWRMEGEFFKSSHDGRCLDFAVHHGLDHLVAWRCHTGPNQRWYIQGSSIRSRQDNRCLARYGNFVRVSHCNPASRGQQWSFRKTHPPVTPPGRDCCSTCSQFGKAFCSPQSGKCYDFQAKPHYQKCGIQPPVNHNCCTKCGPFGKGFCSPQSGRCYDFQAKPQYQKCGVSPPVRPPVEPTCCSRCKSLGKAFCSTQTGWCSNWQQQPHFQRCGAGFGVAQAPAEASQIETEATTGPSAHEESTHGAAVEDDIFYP